MGTRNDTTDTPNIDSSGVFARSQQDLWWAIVSRDHLPRRKGNQSEEGRREGGENLNTERTIVSRKGTSKTKISNFDSSIPNQKILRFEITGRRSRREGTAGEGRKEVTDA